MARVLVVYHSETGHTARMAQLVVEGAKDAGAEVVGISSDTVESHDRFSAHHRLPFVLLSDEGGAVRRLYGVPATLGIIPGRVTYVIDRAGILRHKFSAQFAAQKHVDEALRIVRALQT
jgi:peroxiredoxin Q/BCP